MDLRVHVIREELGVCSDILATKSRPFQYFLELAVETRDMLLVLRSPPNASFNYFLELSIDFTNRAEDVTLDFSRSKTISYHFKKRALVSMFCRHVNH